MTYDESALLMTNLEFRGRVKVSALKYAGSIMIRPTSTAAHNTRIRWAQIVTSNRTWSPTSCNRPSSWTRPFKADSADITDVALQTAVEGVVNQMM
jgi:hypothetical protein